MKEPADYYEEAAERALQMAVLYSFFPLIGLLIVLNKDGPVDSLTRFALGALCLSPLGELFSRWRLKRDAKRIRRQFPEDHTRA